MTGPIQTITTYKHKGIKNKKGATIPPTKWKLYTVRKHTPLTKLPANTQVYHRGKGIFNLPNTHKDAQIRAGPAADHVGGKDNPYKNCGDRYNKGGVSTSGFQKQYKDAFKKAKKRSGHFRPDQLKIGTKVEMEHTKNPRFARKIAIDHLKEIPDYYTRLTKMEEDYKKRKGHYETLEPEHGESLTKYLDRCGVKPEEGIPQGLLRKHSTMWFAEQEKKDAAQKTLSGHYTPTGKVFDKIEKEMHMKFDIKPQVITSEKVPTGGYQETQWTPDKAIIKVDKTIHDKNPDLADQILEHEAREQLFNQNMPWDSKKDEAHEYAVKREGAHRAEVLKAIQAGSYVRFGQYSFNHPVHVRPNPPGAVKPRSGHFRKRPTRK